MSRWDGQYSSAILSLAKELALNNRVFYIDHPFTVKDFLSRFSSREIQSRRSALLFGKNIFKNPQGFPKNFIAVIPPLVLPVNFFPDGKVYDFFSAINDAIVFSAVRKTIRDFEIKKFIFLNSFNPFYARYFPQDIKPALFIYQTRDDITQEKYIARHGLRLENEMVEKADIAFATSKELVNAKLRFNRNTFLLPNAADVELFRKAQKRNSPRPRELAQHNGKVIIYMGNIDRARVDFNLLRNIGHARQDWTLLLVGPVHCEEHIKAQLDKMPNVIFTGPKNIHELPPYVAHADCCIIPFQCNTLTKSIYPLKINEYLTAGKPVVTTKFSEDILEFKDVAYLANSHAQFLEMIEKSMQEDSPQRQQLRIKAAESNSWKARVEMFWKIVERHVG